MSRFVFNAVLATGVILGSIGFASSMPGATGYISAAIATSSCDVERINQYNRKLGERREIERREYERICNELLPSIKNSQSFEEMQAKLKVYKEQDCRKITGISLQ